MERCVSRACDETSERQTEATKGSPPTPNMHGSASACMANAYFTVSWKVWLWLMPPALVAVMVTLLVPAGASG